ncbi:MAG: hypothetical protein ABIV21_06635, partial [Pyrinomonadaceae bacterium]
WPDGHGGFTHQTLQFLRQEDINGTLYLAGVRGKYGSDDSTVDVYRIDCQTPVCTSGGVLLRHMSSKELRPFPNTGGKKLASFAAASELYISPTGELILYATEHDNDGPGNSVKAGEWRHINVVRPGSPTLLPTALVNGPYMVDEGGSVIMSGSARPPVTKAFVQLFHGTDLLGLNPIFDYDDRLKDDYDNLFAFELAVNILNTNPPTFSVFHHADKARSWNWHSPQGCSIKAIDHDENGNVDETRTVTDASGVQRDNSLAAVLNDAGDTGIDQEIDQIVFLPDCDQYYSTAFVLDWDVDRNGVYETNGNTATLSALQLDGPTEANVPVRARHPVSGLTGTAVVKVTVRNVAPALGQLVLRDSGGNQINSAVPFALRGSPVTIAANFTDPGILDHQTASLNWGNGVVKTQSGFTSFNEAFGDGTGSASDVHSYATAGTYTIVLAVTDDDNGNDTEYTSIRVLTPEQAVVEMIAMLGTAIASCPNSAVCFDLQRTMVALAGSNPESVNGALKMIRAGNRPSARAFLDTAGTWLARAEADGGTGLTTLRALVIQVAAAL